MALSNGMELARIGIGIPNPCQSVPIHLENWLLADVDYDVSLVQFILRADQCCNPYGSLFNRLEFPGLAGLDTNPGQCCANPLPVAMHRSTALPLTLGLTGMP